MKKLMMILCLAVMAMFLVSCAPGQAVRTSSTDAALKQQIITLQAENAALRAAQPPAPSAEGEIGKWVKKEFPVIATWDGSNWVVAYTEPGTPYTPGQVLSLGTADEALRAQPPAPQLPAGAVIFFYDAPTGYIASVTPERGFQEPGTIKAPWWVKAYDPWHGYGPQK